MNKEIQITAQKGWCVLTETISGPEMVWRTGEGEEAIPLIYNTERNAQLDVAEDIEEDINQFREGEREYDEIHQFNEYTIAEIEISEQGVITVWRPYDVPHEVKIMEVTLKQWKENL